ncbi:MAG: aldehyde ferredoxin oxidoreductase N-terminal domain-containing protein, partial [Desulfosalsimonadaceae bacterium]
MKGCYGKYLKIDLTIRQTEEIPISEADQNDFIGGSALAARLIYPFVKPGFDPTSPENPLIFAAGPFTGSNVPMVSRSAVCGISPATGLWGEATTGGKFPVRLKATGFDGIMITGRADTPVYVFVNDGERDEQLQQNKEELDRILESTGDGICVIDTDFRVHRANKTYTALIGSSEKEARGKQ